MNGQNKFTAPRAIVQLIIFVILMPLLPLLIAWRLDWWEAWAFASVSILGFIISRTLAAKRNPDIIKERANSMHQEGTQSWDKILSPLVALGGVFILILAGLDKLYGWPPNFSLAVKLAALVVIMAGYVLGSWALVENSYFAGVVRLQKDRGHKVISSGPYRWMRHPGYAGTFATYLAIPFLLDSIWALIPGAILCILLVVRTRLEDRFLQENLEGYVDYTKHTRYRLFPGLW